MAQFAGVVDRTSKDGQKTWKEYTFEDQLGQQLKMSHWGKPLDTEKISGIWLSVEYTENEQGFKNLKLVKPTDAPTKQSGVTEHAEAAPATAAAPAPASKPVQGNLSVSRHYLSLKLAVELVKVEGVAVDKKLERVIEAYKKFLAELSVTD